MKKNVVANYLGQGWQTLMNIAFIPLYIRYLGIEAFGLIGIFALLQSWLRLLDMGMKPALEREMARFIGGAHDAQSIRDLLRSIEFIALGIAAVMAFGIWAASGWLATDWLTVQKLPSATVARVFSIMGVVAALRFIQDVYVGSIVALQRQVLQNVITGIMATVRGVGAVGVLIWLSPTIDAFFIWQGVISVVTLVVFCGAVYRTLPAACRPARFSADSLRKVWHFAAGIVVLTFLSLLLTQVDKILLSRMLALQVFGYYVLAGVLANALSLLQAPITTAFYPRFTELAARGDVAALRAVYHQSAQAVTVLMGAAAVVLIVFGREVLLLWTNDPELTRHVAPLMALLAAGTLLNGLMIIPYRMQLAYGWTSLMVKVNSVAVCLLVPALFWAVPIYGAIAAAWIWVILNAGYLLVVAFFMHRRVLTGEKWNWYSRDLAMPLAAAAAMGLLCHWAAPADLRRTGQFAVLIVSSGFVLGAAALAASTVRYWLVNDVLARFGRGLALLA